MYSHINFQRVCFGLFALVLKHQRPLDVIVPNLFVDENSSIKKAPVKVEGNLMFSQRNNPYCDLLSITKLIKEFKHTNFLSRR